MDIDQIAVKAREFMEYDMIGMHTELPEFPQLRSSLLLVFLNKFSTLAKHSELFSLAVSIVQMGLDTHDLVPESDARAKNKVSRSIQLKVLAGDYFSSRFYHLLSEGGHIGIIQHLSEAICEVNRLKMNLYIAMQQAKLTSEEYIQQTVAVKTHLFSAFSAYMEGIYRKAWQELLYGLTRCEVITQEITRNESGRQFRFSWAFWNIFQFGSKAERKQLLEGSTDQTKLKSLMLKYNITRQLHQMLESQLNVVQAGFKQFDSEKFIAELYQISEPFARLLSAPKVLEEI